MIRADEIWTPCAADRNRAVWFRVERRWPMERSWFNPWSPAESIVRLTRDQIESDSRIWRIVREWEWGQEAEARRQERAR